jgi:hypothetical protein
VIRVRDAEPGRGAAWRRGWDSLRLFSPAQWSWPPGSPMPASADGPHPFSFAYFAGDIPRSTFLPHSGGAFTHRSACAGYTQYQRWRTPIAVKCATVHWQRGPRMRTRTRESKGLGTYFYLTYALILFTWGLMVVFQLPGAASASHAPAPAPGALVLLFLGGFTPSIVGIIMTWYLAERRGLRERSTRRWSAVIHRETATYKAVVTTPARFCVPPAR